MKEPVLESTGKGYSNIISGGADLPVGVFSDTHSFGIGADYSWSNHRFGSMKGNSKKPIGLILNGGADYYFGKEENYGYKYKGYTWLQGYAGLIMNPDKKGELSFLAGPALGIYAGKSNLGFGVNLRGSYYVNDMIAITPAILYMKRSNADALWAGTIRASLSF